MPLPGAVMATATLLSSARFIALSSILLSGYFIRKISTPGNGLPSIHSRNAPPAVDT